MEFGTRVVFDLEIETNRATCDSSFTLTFDGVPSTYTIEQYGSASRFLFNPFSLSLLATEVTQGVNVVWNEHPSQDVDEDITIGIKMPSSDNAVSDFLSTEIDSLTYD